MKKKIKVYFDFLCPFCYKGVSTLLELLEEFPEITVDWEPCEAHPRPEIRDQYSDIASEALLYVKGHKGDIITYIKAVFQAYYIDGKRIDDKDVLVSCAKETGIEEGRLKSSLTRRDYKQDIMANNHDIWDVYEADAVPSFYFRNKKLVSRENHMISKEELRAFLASL